jgi:hypothetical protein
MNLYRSLFIKDLPDDSLFNILEWLAEEGYLQNNRRLDVQFDCTCGCSCSARFPELICSMKNLESLNLFNHELTPDVLAHVFQSCSKLIELHIETYYKTLEMAEYEKSQLRLGFQKLRCLYLVCNIDNDTWPVIQRMLT